MTPEFDKLIEGWKPIIEAHQEEIRRDLIHFWEVGFKQGMEEAAKICDGLEKEIVCPEECAMAIREAKDKL